MRTGTVQPAKKGANNPGVPRVFRTSPSQGAGPSREPRRLPGATAGKVGSMPVGGLGPAWLSWRPDWHLLSGHLQAHSLSLQSTVCGAGCCGILPGSLKQQAFRNTDGPWPAGLGQTLWVDSGLRSLPVCWSGLAWTQGVLTPGDTVTLFGLPTGLPSLSHALSNFYGLLPREWPTGLGWVNEVQNGDEGKGPGSQAVPTRAPGVARAEAHNGT